MDVAQSKGVNELGEVHDKPLCFILDVLSHLVASETNKRILYIAD